MSAAEPDIWVAVASYGAPETMKRPDGSRYGPIVLETDVDGATREQALARAAQLERQGYGASRIARLVFDEAPKN